MSAPTRFPLAWPAGKPRSRNRRTGKFAADSRPITPTTAIGRLSAELERLRADYPLLSTDYPVRLDGSLILNRGAPADPGACIYFSLAGKPYAMACDTYTDPAQNIAAIAAHVEATRAIERYGVATAAETLRAFEALPAPDAAPAWTTVLELEPSASAEAIRTAYREKIKTAHPDAGGSAEAVKRLTDARDAALREVGG